MALFACHFLSTSLCSIIQHPMSLNIGIMIWRWTWWPSVGLHGYRPLCSVLVNTLLSPFYSSNHLTELPDEICNLTNLRVRKYLAWRCYVIPYRHPYVLLLDNLQWWEPAADSAHQIWSVGQPGGAGCFRVWAGHPTGLSFPVWVTRQTVAVQQQVRGRRTMICTVCCIFSCNC